MNIERVVGTGPLKIKYRIISHADYLYGNICFIHDGEEIGDYNDVVNLNDVHDWLNEFSEKIELRKIGFLDGKPKELLLDFIYFLDNYESPSSSILYRMNDIFNLDDNLSYSFLDKFFGILFNDSSMKKQRFIWGSWKDRVSHEILLDIGYFENLISEFSSSFTSTHPYEPKQEHEKTENMIGSGCLKIKYKISDKNRLIGKFCFKNKDIEIGNYRDSVNLKNVSAKLNEFAKNKNKRCIGFLDGDSSAEIFNFIHEQATKNSDPKKNGPLSYFSSQMKDIFYLNECFSTPYFRRHQVILFNDGLIKKQRLLHLNQKDGLLHEFLLDPDYLEDLVMDFSESLQSLLSKREA